MKAGATVERVEGHREPDPVSRTSVLRRGSQRKESWMPAAKPPEFRRRAVGLARRREKSIAGIAHDLGVMDS